VREHRRSYHTSAATFRGIASSWPAEIRHSRPANHTREPPSLTPRRRTAPSSGECPDPASAGTSSSRVLQHAVNEPQGHPIARSRTLASAGAFNRRSPAGAPNDPSVNGPPVRQSARLERSYCPLRTQPRQPAGAPNARTPCPRRAPNIPTPTILYRRVDVVRDRPDIAWCSPRPPRSTPAPPTGRQRFETSVIARDGSGRYHRVARRRSA
jgi:hypothetical protein